ncbi:MAG TPA: hypothetical protein VG826_09485 [Pirellulales bacterium]|nr:hypothetical protein [Pirellulales bacterium]
MGRRFQFNLGRLLGSVSLFCVAVVFWRLSFPGSGYRPSAMPAIDPFALTGFTLVLSAAVGMLMGRAVRFAFVGYLGFVAVSILAIIKLLL